MRLAGQRLTGQLDDPNLPCKGESLLPTTKYADSLLPTTKYADFEADPRERSRQELIAKKGLKNFANVFLACYRRFYKSDAPTNREHSS